MGFCTGIEEGKVFHGNPAVIIEICLVGDQVLAGCAVDGTDLADVSDAIVVGMNLKPTCANLGEHRSGLTSDFKLFRDPDLAPFCHNSRLIYLKVDISQPHLRVDHRCSRAPFDRGRSSQIVGALLDIKGDRSIFNRACLDCLDGLQS